MWDVRRKKREPEKEHGDAQKGNPFEILDHRGPQATLSETVFEQGKPQIAQSGKDDRAREPDLETVQKEAVDLDLESENEVVDKGENGSRGNTV